MNTKEKAQILTVGILGVSLLLLCNGCERTPQERKVATQQSVANPEYVATMPDGRNLYCITVAQGQEVYDHYVYFFSTNDVATISVNHNIHVGKTYRNQTIVIDGATYNLVPASTNN